MRKVCFFFMALVLLTACYYPADETALYAVNDNFFLTADSMWLQTQEPLHNMPIDTLSDSVLLYYDDPLVVAQIVVIPEDSIDSVWVKVARDQFSQGWIHQSTFLSSVVPDDPISEFIYLFSQRHLWYFLGFVFVVLVVVVCIVCFYFLTVEDLVNHCNCSLSKSTCVLEYGHCLLTVEHVLNGYDVAVLTSDDRILACVELAKSICNALSCRVIGAKPCIDLLVSIVGSDDCFCSGLSVSC